MPSWDDVVQGTVTLILILETFSIAIILGLLFADFKHAVFYAAMLTLVTITNNYFVFNFLIHTMDFLQSIGFNDFDDDDEALRRSIPP